MWLMVLKKYWLQIVIIISVIFTLVYIQTIKNDLSSITLQLDKSKAENVLNELQKEALRSAIVDQNNAVEKQRIDAVQRAEEFKVKSDTIQAKYERERSRVSDLNGTAECNAIREIIKGAL
jgi:uncharacterized membrane protein